MSMNRIESPSPMEAGVHAGEILSDGGLGSLRNGREDALWVLHFCPGREEKKAD
jgi:hypothetical protein